MLSNVDDFKLWNLFLKDYKLECTERCVANPNSLVCKLRIFNAKCPTKSLKEDYRTGCYEVVDKNGGDQHGVY